MLGIRDSEPAEWPSNLDASTDVITFRAPVSIRRRGPQMKMVVAGQNNAPLDPTLINALVKARGWAQRLTSGEATSVAEIAAGERVGASYISAILPLAYLAPQIVEEILNGKRSRDQLVRYPGRAPIDPSWRKQMEVIGGPV